VDDRRTPVVLLGIDRLLGLQLARILWRRGLPTVGVAVDPGSPYCRTRAAQRIVPLHELERDPGGLLRSVERSFGARPVVIPCLDELVFWLNEHRDAVARDADFLLPGAEALELLADKGRFYRHLIERDLPLPPTRFVGSRDGLEDAARSARFPVVIKPPRRTPEWMRATGGFKVLRADSPADLRQLATPLLGVVPELVLQAWIEGGDDCMVSLFVCLDRQSRPVTTPLVARKLRQWPPDIGVGCLAQEEQHDELVATGLELLQGLGYVGTGSLQLKREAPTGKLFLIEMNTRFALNFPLCEACGIEATLCHVALAAGLPLPEARSITRPGSKWIAWKRDLASAYAHWRRGDLTARAWLESLRGPKRSADLQLRDPMPFLADLGRKLGGGLSGKASRTLRGRG